MKRKSNTSHKGNVIQVNASTYEAGGTSRKRSRAQTAATRRRVRERTSHTRNANTLITRRNLLFGAAGLGVVAAGAAGAVTLANHEDEQEEIPTLNVPEEAVFDLESCAEVDPGDAFELIGDYELPFGTLVWADDDAVAACLFPTEDPTPLVNMGILQLGNGAYYIMREEAVGAEEGFEIYDVRASSTGMIWMEAAVLEGLWRLYVATLDTALNLGEPRLVDEGDASTEVPTIAIAGEYAFWQIMAPVTNENARHEPSAVKHASLREGKVQTLYESTGRMSAPLVPYQDSIICTPRHTDATSYCDLVRLDAKMGRVLDTLTLPSGMMPNQVSYGPFGFAFCFENIYDYGGGIANLGTYSPAQKPTDGAYDQVEWFRFNRTPTAAPCWCTDTWFMVKSNQSVCAVNFANKIFCSFGVESGCLDWGDFLVSSGGRDTVVSAMQIDDVNTEGEETKMTEVRVWRPLAAAPANPGTDTAQDSNSAASTEENQNSEN